MYYLITKQKNRKQYQLFTLSRTERFPIRKYYLIYSLLFNNKGFGKRPCSLEATKLKEKCSSLSISVQVSNFWSTTDSHNPSFLSKVFLMGLEKCWVYFQIIGPDTFIYCIGLDRVGLDRKFVHFYVFILHFMMHTELGIYVWGTNDLWAQFSSDSQLFRCNEIFPSEINMFTEAWTIDTHGNHSNLIFWELMVH